MTGSRPGLRHRLAALRHRAVKASFPWFERLGVHVSPVQFYEPIPDTRTLGPETWRARSELPGVELDERGQLRLLDELAAYRHEFATFPRGPGPDSRRYHVDNASFEGGDGDALYAMLRHTKPRRVVEVGSGYSTMLAAEALLRNQADGAPPAELVVIDPHPGAVVRRGFPGLSSLDARPVQRVPLERFTSLGAGDVVFVDSSHVAAIGSDVTHEILEVFPRLAPGVLVHVHDVFLPGPYPRELVMERRFFWNEQYLLQAFLAFNTSFEVLLALAWLHERHPDRLEAAFPAYRRDRYLPGSFWFRRRAEG